MSVVVTNATRRRLQQRPTAVRPPESSALCNCRWQSNGHGGMERTYTCRRCRILGTSGIR